MAYSPKNSGAEPLLFGEYEAVGASLCGGYFFSNWLRSWVKRSGLTKWTKLSSV